MFLFTRLVTIMFTNLPISSKQIIIVIIMLGKDHDNYLGSNICHQVLLKTVSCCVSQSQRLFELPFVSQSVSQSVRPSVGCIPCTVFPLKNHECFSIALVSGKGSMNIVCVLSVCKSTFSFRQIAFTVYERGPLPDYSL